MFLVLKKKKLLCIALIVIILFVVICIGIVKDKTTSTKPKVDYTIVIDAGHGARDGGCVGVSGSLEKDLNLEYAKTLKEMLERHNIKIVMTRTTDKQLYEENASNKKLSEMKARAEIIKKANPDLVISIHMNSFPLKSVKGARAFYAKGSEKSKLVADNMQKSMHNYCSAPSVSSSVGDYYILNCTNYPAVLIECGYLSNPEEEKLLQQSSYREKLMHSVYSGVVLSFALNMY